MANSEASSSWDPNEAAAAPAEPGFFLGFWQFLWANWIWWVAPSVLIFLALIAIVFSVQDNAVAPFINALF